MIYYRIESVAEIESATATALSMRWSTIELKGYDMARDDVIIAALRWSTIELKDIIYNCFSRLI